MNINKEIKGPYAPSPSKLMRADIKQEFERLKRLDLKDQVVGLREPVEIGTATVYFSKGISKESPVFLEHTPRSSDGLKRIHILVESAVAVYDKVDRDNYQRRALLSLDNPEAILASLPAKALKEEISTSLASPSQLNVIRKNLGIPADEPLPPMSSAAISRIIDRMMTERDLPALLADTNDWARVATPSLAA